MYQYAVTAPIKILEALYEKELLGTYNLLLAHDVLENPSAYRALFKKLPTSSTIILDNSIIELGTPLSNQHMLWAVEALNRHVIITLPDVLEDTKATMQLVCEASMYFALKSIKKRLPEYTKFMGVLQGENFTAIGACMNLYHHLGPKYPLDVLAIPRIWTNTKSIGTRRIAGLIACSSGFPIHLLGMSNNFEDDLESVKIPGVMGIDSANPIVLGWKGLHISSGTHSPRGNFWDECHELTPMIEDNVRWVRDRLT